MSAVLERVQTPTRKKSRTGSNRYNKIITADSREGMDLLPKKSVDLSFWSPPYHVGKSYEKGESFASWQKLIKEVIEKHSRVVKDGGFLAVNIADILCFRDESIPRYQANNVNGKKSRVTKNHVIDAIKDNPSASRHELASILGCSEQTIQRRLENNNVRGGKSTVSTKVLLTGGMICEWAEDAGFYLYDRKIWRKDPCWANSRWHSNSYRSVDEFEYVYVFWMPGITNYERDRLSGKDWSEWGSRGVWDIPSVRKNDRHEAEFPEMLAERVIRLYSPEGGTVLDPFVGTGTTTTVANRLGRSWFGIDSCAKCTKAARSRTNDA